MIWNYICNAAVIKQFKLSVRKRNFEEKKKSNKTQHFSLSRPVWLELLHNLTTEYWLLLKMI